MNPELLEYFHRELQFLFRQGPEFARRHPDIAPLLEMPARSAADPHVERLIQAFAWMNARVQMQLDGQLDQLVESFFSVVFPHAQRPFPACAVVQLSESAPARSRAIATCVPAGTWLESDAVGRGPVCRFRTVYPVELSGLVLDDASYQSLKPDQIPEFAPSARSVLRLRLRSRDPGGPMRLRPDRMLRLFLRAPRGTSFPLYELLVRHSMGIAVSDGADHRVEYACGGLVKGVGFRGDESLLPRVARTPAGHELLLEFLAFPEKFLFVDIAGLPELDAAEFVDPVEVAIYCRGQSRELEALVSASTIRLDCTPIVNLFPARAEPVSVTHEQPEYLVRPDARHPESVEVYSIDKVHAVSANRVAPIREFFEPSRPSDDRTGPASWIARRERRAGGPVLPDVWLGLSDPSGEFLQLDEWTLDLELTCLNGDLPASLPYYGAGPRLRVSRGADVEVECIVPPTRRLDPPLARLGHGKLVALLALQSLPLFCENAAAEFRLREYVGAWNPNPSRETQAFVECLTDARARQSLDEVWIGTSRCFARGVEITVDLDESRLPGRSACLYASVLEHFLSLSSSINCFTRLTVHSTETRHVLYRSAVRAGEQQLASLSALEPSTLE